ncbi:MAG: 4-(cytidine 5'-diphospho)-2-C-methyl-D-erythritol kinase [Deltaproteobacteria bacterium]|nr:4-(cytidine 5'-diphospho)-2-C-methyl-D-erythritol kinase [Deltaproteobacteria bacterium]
MTTAVGVYQVACPAKVNLTLKVVGRREDGYHLLRMAMEPVSLADFLTLRLTPAAGREVSCRVRPPVAGLEEADNLVVRAATAALRALDEIGPPPPGRLEFSLEKNVPAGAGLGGGSSDAAAALRLVNRVVGGGRLGEDKLAVLALALGADVPFFLRPGLSRVEGIGERLFPCPHACRRWYVLVKPPVMISTAAAYKKLNYKLTKNEFNINMRQFFQRLPMGEKYSLFNDFEEVVFAEFPLLRELKEWLQDRDQAVGALMSGSGSTVYGLFTAYGPAREAYRAAVARWHPAGCQVFLAHNIGGRGGMGPGPGGQ